MSLVTRYGLAAGDTKVVLNVGGNNTDIKLPEEYQEGWSQVILDIDPTTGAGIVCDARDLSIIDDDTFDGVYASHLVEHVYPHEVVPMLAGFRRVTKPGGHLHVRVPDIGLAFKSILENNLGLSDEFYNTGVWSVSVLDMLYGHHQLVEKSLHFAHHTGFDVQSLGDAVTDAGWDNVEVWSVVVDLVVKATK